MSRVLRISRIPWTKGLSLKTFILSIVVKVSIINRALEFIGLSPMNREFGGFLMSDLGRQVMTKNKLSIHVESGDIFYEN